MTNSKATQILGHPRGLVTLFFTEMWERFSYYGMRAMLVLFMTDQIVNGGMALDDRSATAIYGIYTALIYVVALPGGVDCRPFARCATRCVIRGHHYHVRALCSGHTIDINFLYRSAIGDCRNWIIKA